MGDYTTSHCFLLLGNPTTNIEYINGATMVDGLEKYEALAKLLHSKRIAAMHYNQSGITSQVSVPDPDCATAADAITELVAMVREANRILDSSGAELYAAKSDYEQMRERAEAAEKELAQVDHALNEAGQYKLAGEDSSFADRIADLHSNYLRRHKDACEANAQLAELKRKMREPDDELLAAMWREFGKTKLYDASKPNAPMLDTWLAAVNHLLGEKE